MTKSLELSDSQQQILIELLKNVLGDLSYEIADTSVSTYKDQLKEKRADLKAIAAQLED
jgi:hypothetical protein